MAPPRESLPDALAGVFNVFAAEGRTGGPKQIRTSEEWAAMLSAISTAGLLPQPELLQASHDLALPASLAQLQKRLNGAHEPPRAGVVDGLLDGAVARVRHLHGLLAEWELGSLSAEHTARLLAMIEALRGRLSTSVAELRMWHDGIHAALGPERCQTLFWDLLDATASLPDNAHAFQRAQLGAIEKRAAQLRVRSVVLPGDSGFGHSPMTYNVGSAFGSSSSHFPSSHSLPPGASSLGFGVWSSATPQGGAVVAMRATAGGVPAIDVSIGTVPDPAGGHPTKVRVVRCPHAGVTWAETAKLLAWTDATKQLSLSRHAPAYLGHEPCVPANPAGYPPHARWHLEVIDGAAVAEGLVGGGPLSETSLLFRHWRREIIEGLCELSEQTTFLLPHSVTLTHAFAADEGCRIVFDHLAWGAEYPEPDEPNPPTALQQALAAPSSLAAASGQAGEGGEAASGDATATGSSSPQPSTPVGHRELRDTLLLYDGVAMLTALLTGKPQDTRGAQPPRPITDAAANVADDAAAPQRSAYLSAILSACCHATSPPTLKQLLSHPYFAPVDGFDREDVRAAYRRWRKGGVGKVS